MRQTLGKAIRDDKLKGSLKFDIERMLLTSDLSKDKDAYLNFDLADYPEITDSDQVFEIEHYLNVAVKIEDNHVFVFYNRPAKESNSLIDKKHTRLLKLIKNNKIFSNLELGSLGALAACLLVALITGCFSMNKFILVTLLILFVIVVIVGITLVIACWCNLVTEHHLRLEFNKQIKNAKKK